MSAVATSTGLVIPRKRLRSNSSSDELDNEGNYKLKRPHYYYVLAPESSDLERSDSDESIYSIQARSTDIAKDTSDTSDTSSVIEFDVVSLSDEQVYPFTKDTSSSPEDVDRISMPLMPLKNQPTQSDSEKSVGSEGFKNCQSNKYYLFLSCALCGIELPAVPYRYCLRCYKIRKNFFPPRPKKRKTIKKKIVQQDSGISLEITSDATEPVSAKSEETSERNDVCGTCLERPKDGGYVHKSVVHVYACYHCSKKILKYTGRCPICNTRVNQVCKVITV